MSERDEAPETTPENDPPKEPEKETPKEPEKETPKEPEKESPKETGSDSIPEWGKELTAKVDGIIEALRPPMPDDGDQVESDDTPVRPPWHKRSLFGS